jgi:hypothetical protein
MTGSFPRRTPVPATMLVGCGTRYSLVGEGFGFSFPCSGGAYTPPRSAQISRRTPRRGVWLAQFHFFFFFSFFCSLLNLNESHILNKFQNLNEF